MLWLQNSGQSGSRYIYIRVFPTTHSGSLKRKVVFGAGQELTSCRRMFSTLAFPRRSQYMRPHTHLSEITLSQRRPSDSPSVRTNRSIFPPSISAKPLRWPWYSKQSPKAVVPPSAPRCLPCAREHGSLKKGPYLH